MTGVASRLRSRPSAPEAVRDGQPRALYVLFFAEMWERFSYYGMRALLVFYLTKHILMTDKAAYGIYGAYTALVFITPVVGGYLADRYLGPLRAVIFGGVIICAGHLTLAMSDIAQGMHELSFNTFSGGLAAVVVGTGFLKSNISVLVGRLYERDDGGRDAGFSIFYMGINIGGALGPLACGALGERVGWSWGFGAAGIGMAVGLAVLIGARRILREDAAAASARWEGVARSKSWRVYLAALAAVPAVWLLVRNDGVVGVSLLAFSAAAVAYVLYRTIWTFSAPERSRLFAALFLLTLGPVFWALFEQSGSSLNLYTDRSVDRHVLGWVVPATSFQSLPSIFIVLLAPLAALTWTALARRNLEPAAAYKFGIGLLFVAVGFFVFMFGATSHAGALTPIIYVVALYFFQAVGELCFSPVGLAAMTRLSPSNFVGLMMGMWFLSTAAGNFLAAQIAKITAGSGSGSAGVLEVYPRLGLIALIAGALALLAAPMVARLARGGATRALDLKPQE